MDLLRKLAAEQQATIIAVTHDEKSTIGPTASTKLRDGLLVETEEYLLA